MSPQCVMKLAVSLELGREVNHFREHRTTHGDSEQVFTGTLATVSLPQPEAVSATLVNPPFTPQPKEAFKNSE